MKATSFETSVDNYKADNFSLMDEEMLDTDSVREDFMESKVDYGIKPKKNEKKENNYKFNHELRLVNAYFKEVGSETLLKAKDEINIAAKIKECEQQKLKSVSHKQKLQLRSSAKFQVRQLKDL